MPVLLLELDDFSVRVDRGGAVLVPIPPLSSARRRAWNLGTPEREALTSRRSINQ